MALQVRDLTGTGEVTKRRVKDGVGEFPIDCPLEDNAVRAHYKGYLPDSGKVRTSLCLPEQRLQATQGSCQRREGPKGDNRGSEPSEKAAGLLFIAWSA